MQPGHPEVISETVETSPATLEKMLMRDFYLSFRFSQGSAPAQEKLMLALGTAYQQLLPPPATEWITNSSLLPIIEHLPKLQPPTSHVGIDYVQTNYESEFNARGMEFANILSEPQRDEIDTDSICLGLIKKDGHYQENQRGHRAKDVHSSYFRQYVLLGNPTGSAAFNHIFKQCNEFIQTKDERTCATNTGLILPGLVSLWEANHPDEQFYPEGMATPA